jgi:hypothetical protein
MSDKCEKHDTIKICLTCWLEAEEIFKKQWSRSFDPRELIPIEPLPEGALPIYDRDIKDDSEANKDD